MSEIVVRNIFDDEISALCKAEGNESVDNVHVPDGKGVYFNYKPYDPSMGNVDPESSTLSFIKHLK